MRIAVIHHNEDLSNDYAAYLASLLESSAAENGYAIKDYDHLKLANESIKEEDAVLNVILPATGSFSMKYWYSRKLRKIFRKYKIDKVFSLYAIAASTKTEQILIFPDIALLHNEKALLPWQQFAAARLKKSLQSCSSVITYSASAGKVLENNAENTLQKMVLPYTVNELFKPMEWQDKLYIKSRFAANQEYFAAVLPDENEKIFTELLKAFSKFKKWQQSSMQLVLLPKEEVFSNAIEKKLDTYKYQNDVKLIYDAQPKDTADIIAAAYAMLHPSSGDAYLWPVAAALKTGTPVVAFYSKSIEEYCGEAAMLVKETSPESFGEQMIQVYKNETLKTKMSEEAIVRSANLQQSKCLEMIWDLINKKS